MLCILYICTALAKLTDEAILFLPEKFLDSQTSNIMVDPVKLPTEDGSEKHIDRSVLKFNYNIKGNRMNPFTSQPLQLQGNFVTDTDPATDTVLQSEIMAYINDSKNLKNPDEAEAVNTVNTGYSPPSLN